MRIRKLAVTCAATAALIAPVAVFAVQTAAPAAASVCCYVQEEQPTSNNYYMSDTYPGKPVNLTSIRETYYVETLPATFGGHVFFDYQDSKNYCLTAMTPTPHQPSFVGSEACDSSSSGQRWRWIASGSWHYLQNLHYGQNAVDSYFAGSCTFSSGCSDVVVDPFQFQWGVFSG